MALKLKGPSAATFLRGLRDAARTAGKRHPKSKVVDGRVTFEEAAASGKLVPSQSEREAANLNPAPAPEPVADPASPDAFDPADPLE